MATILKRIARKVTLAGPEYSYVGDPVRISPSVVTEPEPFEYVSDPVTAPRPTFGPWADHHTNCKCNVCR